MVSVQNFFDLPQSHIDLIQFGINRNHFVKRKRVKINQLHPNQPEVDPEVILVKRKGRQLTIPVVLQYGTMFILLDGHHTVSAKKMNGQSYVYAKYLKIDK